MSMGIEVEIRIDLVLGTTLTLMDLEMAFINGLGGRHMDFVEPDSRVLRQMVNVSLPSKYIIGPVVEDHKRMIWEQIRSTFIKIFIRTSSILFQLFIM